jgi:tetratricopeptide (TPR) repeat protein
MSYIKKIILSFSLVFLLSFFVKSQTTKVYNDLDEEFKLAKEWYQKGDYSLAYPIFKKYYLNDKIASNFPEHLQTETSFYYLANALNLDDALVVGDAVKFIEVSEAQVARQQTLCFVLAKYYFRQKQYASAIDYFTKAGTENLSNQEIATMQFQKAYAFFATKQFNEAKVLFNSISQIPNDANYIDANYYYGFICFFDKNYQQALKSFTIAEQDALYKNVVPFYIAEIYYFLGDKEKALEISEKALKSNPPQIHELELKQLVGHLYFDKKEYEKALPYLATYVDKNDKVRREDLYQLSFCYYASKDWAKAINGFKQLGGKEDSLAQNSMYLLADAYLKTNQKVNARNAFLFCSGNSSNAIQKEVSAFNYAKLSYELGYLDIAINEFKKFNNLYSKSNYQIEAQELLISALANTSNYKDALSLYEALPIKSESVKKIYPRILYSRATELINDRQIAEAEILLNKVLVAPYNQSQINYTYFWKGELCYRNGKIDEAIGFINNYLINPSINGEISITNAKYNLAYCYFKIGNYKEALSNFEFITKNIQLASSKLEQDVFLRSADCYFMQKNYQNALKNYKRIIDLNIETADYASLQTSIIAGALGNEKLKIETLENIPYQFPNSNLVGDAYMELAKTFMANENFENAIVSLKEIIKNKKYQNLFPEAYLKLGIAYFNLNKNQESLQ